MGFNVDPTDIRRFASELAVLEQSAGDAARQTRYTDPRATGGAIFLRLMEKCNDVESVVPARDVHAS